MHDFMARQFARVWHLIVVLTTARDNETPSFSRLLAIIGAVTFFHLAYRAYVVGGTPFDPLAFATALGVLYTSTMAAIRIGLKANAGNDPQAAGDRAP